MDLTNQVAGFFVTLRQFFKPPITVQYSDQMRASFRRAFVALWAFCPTPKLVARSALAAAYAPRSALWTASP